MNRSELKNSSAADMFYYDETSPSCLMHKVDKRTGVGYSVVSAAAHTPAGGLNVYGYYVVRLNGKKKQAHRLILEMFGHNVGNKQVDHINGNRYDNRISNLRIVSQSENMRNIIKQSNNTTGITGVSLCQYGTGRWYYVVTWFDEEGRHNKAFSIKKLGVMTAFRNSIILRQKMIAELNTKGFGYTDRHGKEQLWSI